MCVIEGAGAIEVRAGASRLPVGARPRGAVNRRDTSWAHWRVGRRTRGRRDVRGRFARHARTAPGALVGVFRAVFTAATRRGRFPRPPGGLEKASRCVSVARAASGRPESRPKEARPQCDTPMRELETSHAVSRAKPGNLGDSGWPAAGGLIRRVARGTRSVTGDLAMRRKRFAMTFGDREPWRRGPADARNRGPEGRKLVAGGVSRRRGRPSNPPSPNGAAEACGQQHCRPVGAHGDKASIPRAEALGY